MLLSLQSKWSKQGQCILTTSWAEITGRFALGRAGEIDFSTLSICLTPRGMPFCPIEKVPRLPPSFFFLFSDIHINPGFTRRVIWSHFHLFARRNFGTANCGLCVSALPRGQHIQSRLISQRKAPEWTQMYVQHNTPYRSQNPHQPLSRPLPCCWSCHSFY